MNFLANLGLKGKKTYFVMGFALLVGLVQHFGGPLPEIDPEVWSMALPIAGIILRYITKLQAKPEAGQ